MFAPLVVLLLVALQQLLVVAAVAVVVAVEVVAVLLLLLVSTELDVPASVQSTRASQPPLISYFRSASLYLTKVHK